LATSRQLSGSVVLTSMKVMPPRAPAMAPSAASYARRTVATSGKLDSTMSEASATRAGEVASTTPSAFALPARV